MNSINPDLQFTGECAEDFDNNRLPTLDTEQQKHSILTNELVRRLSKVGRWIPDEEKVKIIDKFTRQLKIYHEPRASTMG